MAPNSKVMYEIDQVNTRMATFGELSYSSRAAYQVNTAPSTRAEPR